MKVLLSWIRDFVDVPGTPEEIGRRLSLHGLALEGLEPAPPGAIPPGSRHEGPDAVLDFDVTANRPDCLSIHGIAREIATVYDRPLRMPGPAGEGLHYAVSLKPAEQDGLPVSIEAPDLCARYAAAVAPVRVGPSPPWLQARLAACGVRPINNIVDITNYVLLETGHPMHAFDLGRLQGPAIVARRAREGERLETLDGKTRPLTPDMVVIADGSAPQAIGGVMGGARSEVTAATKRIVFEAAWFKPQSVRATSKRLGLRTEASHRFERGADLTAPVRAMARACAMLEWLEAGEPSGTVIDCYPTPHVPVRLLLDYRHIRSLLGLEVPDADVVRILTALGFAVTPASADGWHVTAPGWRVDIQRPVDLIEEIGRHFGFDRLPPTFPGVQQAPGPSDPRIARDARVRRALLAQGFSEAITFAFVEDGAAAPFLDGASPVTLANPLSETFSTMRPSLLPGLVDAVSHNRRRARRDVQLFEIGTTFAAAGETRAAAAVWTGAAAPEHWSGAARDVDFFDAKGAVEAVGAALDVELGFEAAARPYLVEGRTAEVRLGDAVVGVVGQLAPAIAAARDLPEDEAVYAVELSLDALTAGAPAGPRLAAALPRFPGTTRDVSILVDDSLSAAAVRGTIRAAAPGSLTTIREFDRYQGQGIPDGKVSLSLRLTFQAADRTLTDEEIHTAMQGIVDALAREHGAVQR